MVTGETPSENYRQVQMVINRPRVSTIEARRKQGWKREAGFWVAAADGQRQRAWASRYMCITTQKVGSYGSYPLGGIETKRDDADNGRTQAVGTA